ncbi:MAG: hypothetical protein K2L87_02035 [Clostridiales bacterium]|nr:hypothetical protein [Clostridiales bacterium]
MAVLDELLEYQKIDGELRKIEQEVAASEERKKYMQAKKFMNTAGEKLDAQDNRAVELKKAARNLAMRFKQLSEELADYSALDEMVEEGGEISYYKKNVQTLADNLRAIKGELQKLVGEIENACDEYKRMKEQTISMQKQYREYSEKFKEVKESRAADVNAINKKLSAIAAKIPADILEKYTVKRKDIFPVVAPLTNGRCICGMEFSIALLGKLTGGQVIECEHCRRIIYNK